MGLPTTGWQAGIWVALALGAWPAARAARLRLEARFGDQAGTITNLGAWVHALGPAYLALISGAVTGRDLGIYGPTTAAWASAAVGIAGGLGAAWLVFRFRHPAIEPDSPWTVALNEPRWALYRAAGIGWVGGLWLGLAIGLVLAAADWGLRHSVWQADGWKQADVWRGWMRAGLSAVLFAATRNLWLIIVCQAGLAAMTHRRR